MTGSGGQPPLPSRRRVKIAAGDAINKNTRLAGYRNWNGAGSSPAAIFAWIAMRAEQATSEAGTSK